MAFIFDGQVLITPVTASNLDDSGMDANNPSYGNVLAIIGQADNAEPFVPKRINSYADAVNFFGTNEPNLLKAIQKAFNPSEETLAPAYIQFVRINNDGQAQVCLKDTNNANAILVKAVNWGPSGANIRVVIAAGTKANSLRLTVKYPTTSKIVGSLDNLNRSLFSIRYAGSGTAVMEITDETLDVTIGSTVTSFPFSVHNSIQGLVDALNDLTGITAIVLSGNGTKATSGLDAVAAATDIKTATVIAKGQTQMIIDLINARFSKFITAERQTGAVRAVDTTVSGGVALTYTPPGSGPTLNDWQDGFDALKQVDCQWVVPMSDDADVHAMAAAHCDYMSDVAFMERRAFVGLAGGTSNDDAMAAAEVMDNRRVAMVHQRFYDSEANAWPPYVLAALLAGMFCGVTPGTALTNKSINVRGMERRLRNPEETDLLLGGGIVCCWADFANNIKVLQSITTAQSDNYSRREMSVVVASDYIAKAIRDTLNPLRGQKNTPYLPQEVLSRAETRLKQLAIPEPQGEGVIVGDKNSPAFKGLTVTSTVDGIHLEFQCSPVIPDNYIGITIHTVPYTGTTI